MKIQALVLDLPHANSHNLLTKRRKMKIQRFAILAITVTMGLTPILNAQQLYVPNLGTVGSSSTNNVGIGIVSPISRLEVGSSGATGLLQLNFSTSLGSVGSNLGGGEPGGSNFTSPSFGIKLVNNNTSTGTSYSTFLVEGSGKTQVGDFTGVLVNTKLNVRSNMGVYFNTSKYMKFDYGSNSSGASIIWNNTQDGAGDQLSFRFGTGVTAPSLLTLNPLGQLGLGTTNFVGNHKLFVGGTIIAEELTAKLQTNWPDYVFAEDYVMMTNEDLEAYIKEHRHLPGMPSAAQVAEEGLDVAKTEALLLEKVEELTLRLLQLDTLVKDLQKQLEDSIE